MESIDRCVMLDGNHLAASNPLAEDELEDLHSTVALLVEHHRRFGYCHFVLNHIWRSPGGLADLRRRLDDSGEQDVRCFLLTLSAEENLRRLERRQQARVLDEREFELRMLGEERRALGEEKDLGEPFDCGAPPDVLVQSMFRRLGIAAAG